MPREKYVLDIKYFLVFFLYRYFQKDGTPETSYRIPRETSLSSFYLSIRDLTQYLGYNSHPGNMYFFIQNMSILFNQFLSFNLVKLIRINSVV